jgi:mono/diheme cytochrome c family protein
MHWQVPDTWLSTLLETWLLLQRGLQELGDALGLLSHVHGQISWPWTWRLAAETLWNDPSHVRAVVITLADVALALLFLALSFATQKYLFVLRCLAALPLVLAPWPATHLWLAPAVPTSFHHTTRALNAQTITEGEQLYAQHCVHCHGHDARGEGPDAAKLKMWPPDLTGKLLWRRLEGELFWRIQHGMKNRHGDPTMPAFSTQLSDEDTWHVLNYLEIMAAGSTLRQTGLWQSPLHLPDLMLNCRYAGARQVRDLRGQFLRVVFLAKNQTLPQDDPRLVTILVGEAKDAQPECQTTDKHATHVMSLLLGISENALPGHQVLVDRQGWLRAHAKPNQAQWSDDNLVCRTEPSRTPNLPSTRGVEGLESLLRKMDAEPVRPLRGAYPH